MHIVVMGAGVTGTTTAYYLSQVGHDVTVNDRQSNVALETSFANAGQISLGYASSGGTRLVFHSKHLNGCFNIMQRSVLG